MGKNMINGVLVTPLKQIYHPKGDVYHAMKGCDPGFMGFGEAYFSTIVKGSIKAWKRHSRMTLNLVCISGCVHFVLYDGRTDSCSYGNFMEVTLSPQRELDYSRLTIPPGVWMGFVGMIEGKSILLNLADIQHDPLEQINVPIKESEIKFDWNRIIKEL